MKIPASIRRLYQDQVERYQKLKELADRLVESRLKNGWHYESRVKSAESYTLKAESGRVEDLMALEDFFASTVVVRNAGEVREAEQIIRSLFTVQNRRPKLDTETHKSPDAFPFDDLRLYVRWVDDPAAPPSGLAGCLFEVQIKTFLQHAWAIATHDLIYKTDDANWSKMRIAYQIKAMLEHAEISIQAAAKLSETDGLAKSDKTTLKLMNVVRLLTELWDKEDLPGDVRRLAENIISLARCVSLEPDDLRALLEEEKKLGRGPLTRNLTPYGIVLETIFKYRRDRLSAALSSDQKFRVLIPQELELPDGVDASMWKAAIIVSSQ